MIKLLSIYEYLFFLDAIEREQRKQTLCLAYTGIGPPFFNTDTVESVVGK